MKELTIKQKAEAYDKAIEKLRDFYRDYDTVSLLINVKEELANIFPELKESEDERIRKEILTAFSCGHDNSDIYGHGITYGQVRAWLEKQGEHANFRNKIQIGDKVTRNEGGVLVNISQLNRVAKERKKQGEQILANIAKTCKDEQKPNPYSGTSFDYDGHTWGMCARDNGVELLLDGELKAFLSLEKSFIYPIHSQSELAPKSALEAVNEEKVDNANKVEPKFCKGDWVVTDKCDTVQIKAVNNGYYTLYNGMIFNVSYVDKCWHLWSIADAKDGDVLATKDAVFIFKHIDKTGLSLCKSYCEVIGNSELGLGFDFSMNNVYPATKEQRDTLFSKMKEEGYVWLSGKKRLVKLLFKEGDTVRKKLDGSIWHINYINEHGYWGNHKPLFPIENQNEFELVEKKHWSEEDEKIIQWIATDIKRLINDNKKANIIADQEIKWLESLRPRSQWKPSDEQMDALDSTLQYSQVSHNSFEHLNSLFNDLKKLKL